MKRISVVITLLVFVLLGFNLSAQTKIKLAHVNSNDLIMLMPGIDSIQKSIEDYGKLLQDELKAMYAEYEKKAIEFQEKGAFLSDAMRKTKEQEIRDLENRIRTFQEQAQEDLQTKEQELFKPIVDKAKAAIADVAKEQGYTYVFDTALGVLLYSDDSDNIIELVKKKLGIK